jgi:hypothetical protein
LAISKTFILSNFPILLSGTGDRNAVHIWVRNKREQGAQDGWNCSYSSVCAPAMSTSPVIFLEMQNLSPHPISWIRICIFDKIPMHVHVWDSMS